MELARRLAALIWLQVPDDALLASIGALPTTTAEDVRRLAAGKVTPDELQRENSFIWSAADILHVDLTPKGTEESWARIMHNLQQNSESI